MISDFLSSYFEDDCFNPILRNVILFGPCSVLLHWITTNIYAYYCVTNGILGLLNSFFTIISPQCVLLTTIMNFTFNFYTMLWKYIIGSLVVFSSMLLKKIILK